MKSFHSVLVRSSGFLLCLSAYCLCRVLESGSGFLLCLSANCVYSLLVSGSSFSTCVQELLQIFSAIVHYGLSISPKRS